MKRNLPVLFVLLLLFAAFAVPQAKHAYAASADTYTVTATIDGQSYSLSGTDQYVFDIDQFIQANGISETAKLQKISVATPDGVTSISYDFAGLDFLFPNKDITVVNNKAEYVLSDVLGAYDSNHDGVALSNLRQLLAPFNNQVTASLTANYADGTSQALKLIVKATQSTTLPSSDKVNLTGISLMTSAGEIKATANNGKFTFDLRNVRDADITAIKFTSDNADTLSIFTKDSVFYGGETDLHFANHEAVVDSSKFASALETVLSKSSIGTVIGTNLADSSNQTLATVNGLKLLLLDAQMKDFNGIVADAQGNQSTFAVNFYAGGWVGPVDGKYVYFNEDNTLHTGWLLENGHYYYFSPNDGYMVTGWVLSNSKWYYMDPTNGEMKTGFIQYNSKQYYLDPNGVMLTGWQFIDGKWYFLDQVNGDAKTGFITYNGKKYYMDPVTGAMQIGWQSIDGKWYFFDTVNGAMKTGFVTVLGKTYLLDSVNGDMKTGWQSIGGKWYYFDPINGSMQTGFITDNGKKYYLNNNGAMISDWAYIDGAWHFFNRSSGYMITGWLADAGNWYFFNNDGAMQTGWLQDGGTWYFLNANGSLKTGWLPFGGTWYFLNSNGAMQIGWLPYGGKWYFFNNDGSIKTGWLQNGSTWYFLNANGTLKTGWLSYGGVYYFLNRNGAMQTGWLPYGGKWYFFNNDGTMQIGWKLINGSWYYFYSSGAMAYNTTINGYVLNSGGVWVS